MITTPDGEHASDVHDDDPDFVHAVSLAAALERAAGQQGHVEVLPYLGMARAELVDFGQRRPRHYVDIEFDDFRAGLADLGDMLAGLQASCEILQQTLRIDAARGFLRRGIATID